ncbi:MAG: putative drug exporter of the superfamily [Solirubrobacteraceae bacterium]|nr:putative drug exporter of the superfamily [Solirubrobacteraceae bacterium]
MQRLMMRLDAAVVHRRKVVLAAWVALLAIAVPLAMHQSDKLSSGGFGVPGSPSQRVSDALDHLPGAERTALAVVLIGRADVRRTAAVADRVDRVRAIPSAAITRGGVTVLPLRVDASDDEASDVANDLRDALGVGTAKGIHLTGQGALWSGLQVVSKEGLAKAEATGFPIVLLILLGVFGSLAAALLPLALGFASVLVTGAIIFFLSRSMEMSVFVTNMASMIGIGVAVDYSLFVLARYREEIELGFAPGVARSRAMATSGVAVLFSGLTVMVSLAGLWMIDNNAIRSMALGAIVVVAVSLLASVTLLPALIGVLGPRAYAPSARFIAIGMWARRFRRHRASDAPFWDRWTARVTRRPVVSVLAAAGVLLVLAIPALSMKTGTGALRQFPAANETRIGIEAAASVTPPGAGAPVKALVPNADVQRYVALARADKAVVTVGVEARDATRSLIGAIPVADGESDATKALVARLRAAAPYAAVGGVTAAQSDIQHLISGSMWKVLLFVLGLSFVVLMVLLRSVVLPLKAVLMNLLSVGAAYGVLVAIFQWGWIDGFLGFQSSGHIDTLTPPLVLAVVFGLSMDYEVFLLTRIRERYQATGDTQRAVAEGLARSARTITSAAMIMVAVFAVFVGTGVPSIKELGVGNAVAIAVDASLVRLVLVPAAMELLGAWNWWLPKPLARILPKASFEDVAVPSPV